MDLLVVLLCVIGVLLSRAWFVCCCVVCLRVLCFLCTGVGCLPFVLRFLLVVRNGMLAVVADLLCAFTWLLALVIYFRLLLL